MSVATVCARSRIPLVVAGLVVLIVGDFLLGWLPWLGLGLFAVGLALYLRVGTVRREPLDVRPPVAGRWLPVNSPATRVPSHGLHAYGQTYAIDLIYEPWEDSRPGFGWWPLARRPEEFPGFGQPVYAPASGNVVRVHGWERDHWSRTSVPALLYMVVESVREVLGPSRVLGNHVVLQLDDGVYAVLAHLQRRSLQVRKGQRVDVGDQVGACGNSGNSTEPHVHFQLMDHRSVLVAAGLPARFARYEVDGEARAGMPANFEHIVA